MVETGPIVNVAHFYCYVIEGGETEDVDAVVEKGCCERGLRYM
jgi:hypothetical protein